MDTTQHLLTVVNAVDVPDSIASEVMRLLAPYSPDIYLRECDETGHTT